MISYIGPVYSEEGYRCFKSHNNTAEQQREPARKKKNFNRSSDYLPYLCIFIQLSETHAQVCEKSHFDNNMVFPIALHIFTNTFRPYLHLPRLNRENLKTTH